MQPTVVDPESFQVWKVSSLTTSSGQGEPPRCSFSVTASQLHSAKAASPTLAILYLYTYLLAFYLHSSPPLPSPSPLHCPTLLSLSHPSSTFSSLPPSPPSPPHPFPSLLSPPQSEAFDLWQNVWGSLYPKGSVSRDIISSITESYYLINLVDNDYVRGSCLWDLLEEVLAKAKDPVLAHQNGSE